MPRHVRKLRHWKQQFDPNARFVFRRPVKFGKKSYKPGDEMPESLQKKIGRAKLKFWWEGGYIELLDFSDPAQTPAVESEEASEPAGASEATADGSGDGPTSDGGEAEGGEAEAGSDQESEAEPSSGEGEAEDQAPQVGIEDQGGGWYLAKHADGTEVRLRGQDQVDTYLASLEDDDDAGADGESQAEQGES